MKIFPALFVLVLAGTGVDANCANAEGPVILTINGAIETADGATMQDFDYDALEALGTVTIETPTTFTDGIQVFEGVPLAALLEALSAEGDMVTATALNDYQVDIPMEMASQLLLATRLNGERMSVRDKGPVWIVYDHAGLDRAAIDDMDYLSVWQLRSLTVH